MKRKTFTVDIDILARMRSMDAYRSYSAEELIRLIRIGMEILDENDRLFKDQGSHYHLPRHQKEAVTAATSYRQLQSKP